MNYHRNAKLTLAQRRELVLSIEEGATQREAATAFNVSVATVNRWWRRFQRAGLEDRFSLRCLHDRSSRPRRSPRQTPRAEEDRICEIRKHTGWGPRQIASQAGHPHSTVHRVLARRGCSRTPKAPPETVQRYEWPCPGNLLHMDIKRFARFDRPGHAITGDRTVNSRGIGWEYAHSIIDDCTRLAYTEILPDQRADTVTAFTCRALDWYLDHGIVAERLMTDNAWSYVKNRSLAELLDDRQIIHKRIRPYRPQTNGKVERYQQTLAREWAYGMSYASSSARHRALSHWLNYYNHHRRHSGIGDRPPTERVRNLCGQDN